MNYTHSDIINERAGIRGAKIGQQKYNTLLVSAIRGRICESQKMMLSNIRSDKGRGGKEGWT